MAIAKNFLKFPQAMALQWPLPLGKARAWETPHQKKYQGRGYRTLLSRAAKVAARRAARALNAMSFAERLERAGAVKKPAPQWWRDAKRRAQEVPRRFVWNLTARIHRSGARWGLWATRQSELSTNPPGGAFC